MTLIGYARVSTDEQDTAAQHDALRAQGCTLILEDKASGRHLKVCAPDNDLADIMRTLAMPRV